MNFERGDGIAAGPVRGACESKYILGEVQRLVNGDNARGHKKECGYMKLKNGVDEMDNGLVEINGRKLVFVNGDRARQERCFEELRLLGLSELNKSSGQFSKGLLWHKNGHHGRPRG